MPLQGIFNADFTSFTNACAQAEVSLKAFETDAGKVEGAVTRIADALSGQKIVQQAYVAEAAIQQIGGVTKLTTDELIRMGGIAQQAVDKLTALGQAVPPGMQNLADRARGASEEMLRLKEATESNASAWTMATGVLAGFGISLGASQLVQWGKEGAQALIEVGKAILDNAGALADMSAKTGLSVEQLQKFAEVGAAAHVSVEDFTQSAFKLGVALEGGAAPVVDAVNKLKLNYQALMQLKPDEQFNTVAKALEGVADVQERNRLGVELMGKSYSAIAPAIAQGFTDMAAQASAATTAQIEALDKLGDAWDQFVVRTKNAATAQAGAAVIGAEAFTKLTTFQQLLVLLSGNTTNLAETFNKLTRAGEAAAANMDIVLPKQEKRVVMTKAEEEAAKKLADAMVELNSAGKSWQGTIDTIDGSVVEAIKYYLDAGVSQKALATAYGLTETQVKAVATSVTELTKTQTAADAQQMASYAAKIKVLDTVAAANAKAYGTQEQIAALQRLDDQERALTESIYANITSEKDRMKLIEDYGKAHEAISAKIIALENQRKGVVNAAVLAELDAQTKLNAAYGLTASGGIAQQDTAYKQMMRSLDELHAKKVEGISQTNQENVIYQTYTDALLTSAKAEDAARDATAGKNAELRNTPATLKAAEDATRSYAKALETLQGGVKLPGSTEEHAFGQTYIVSPNGQRIAVGPHGELPDSFWQQYMGQSSFSSGINTQPRIGTGYSPPSFAEGGVGDFGSGTLALLHGKEAIVPLGSGTVAGATTIQIYVTQPLGTPDQIADVVGRAIMQNMRQQGVRVPPGA